MRNDEMFADPEPFDEDKPENKLELFEMYKEMGSTPEDLTGASKEHRDEYAEWLTSSSD